MTEPSVPRYGARADQPGSRRVGNLSSAIRRAEAVGRLTRGEIAAIATGVVVAGTTSLLPLPLPWLLQVVLAVALGAVLGTEVARRAIPRRVRRALEAFGYLGEWELERAHALGVDAAGIATPADARRWLAAHPEVPEDRWLRWELLLLADDPAWAAEVAARIPEDTPYDRFERAYAIDRVAWSQGGTSDVEALRVLAAEVGPPDDEDRRHAEVALAIAEAKERAAAGEDFLAPLEAAREHLPADVGLGRQFVMGLRLLALVASIVAAIVTPALLTFGFALLGRAS